MLPKAYRLNLKHEFQKIRNTGDKIYDGPLALFWAYDQSAKNWQANITVPVKVTKIKPSKNRIKRILMQSLHKLSAEIAPNCKIVILVNKDISTWHQQYIDKIIYSMLKKSKIIHT